MTLEFDANGRFPSNSFLENKFSWWYSQYQINLNFSSYLLFRFFNAYNQVFIIESTEVDSTNTIWNPEISLKFIYFYTRRPRAPLLCPSVRLSVRPYVCMSHLGSAGSTERIRIFNTHVLLYIFNTAISYLKKI